MTEAELRAFMQGVVVSNEGKIIISKTTVGTKIANIDYGENGSEIVTYTDGSVININKVKTDDDGKITRIYMSANGENKYIECTYDNDYLRTVGDIHVDDVESLEINTNFNLQNKTVTASTKEDITVVCDEGYEGLGTVTVTKADISLQEKTVTPTAESQTVTNDDDYDGLSSVVVNGDTNLIPENIKKGVTIFDVLGTLSGSGGGTGEDMETTTLWEGVHEGTDSIQLYDSVLNYDFIILELSSYYSSSDSERVSNKYEIIPKDKITINEGNHLTIKYQSTIFFNTSFYKTFRFGFETETSIVFSDPNGNWDSAAITGIYGIKFGSSVGLAGVDTDNVVAEITSSVGGTEWTATEDCWIVGNLISENTKDAYIYINGVPVEYVYSRIDTVAHLTCVPAKKGQVVKITACSDTYIKTFKAYGVYY